METKQKFYQLQRERKFKNFYLLMTIPVGFGIILTLLMILLYMDIQTYHWAFDEDLLFVLVCFGISYLIVIGLFLFLMFKYGQVKKYIFGNFESRSPQAKQQIETDLQNIRRVRGIEFGAEGMYFNDRCYIGFTNYIPYDEVAWCYVKSMQTGMGARPDLITSGSISTIGLIIIFTKDGLKHVANDLHLQHLAGSYLQDITNKSPHARYGYTKENKLWWKDLYS